MFRPAVSLSIQKNDPSFVDFYVAADKATLLLEVSIREATAAPQDTRPEFYAVNWTVYIGTLLQDVSQAVLQLAIADLVRPAVLLNRQVYEYWIWLSYLYKNPDKATALMDSLPYRVWQEAEKAPGFFKDARKRYRENHEAWLKAEPNLDSEATEANFTRIAKEMVDKADGNREFFIYYGIPSILAHGRPHGIIEVIENVDGVRRRHDNSPTTDAPTELSKLCYFVLQASHEIRARFGLSMEPLREVNDLHAKASERWDDDAPTEQVIELHANASERWDDDAPTEQVIELHANASERWDDDAPSEQVIEFVVSK